MVPFMNIRRADQEKKPDNGGSRPVTVAMLTYRRPLDLAEAIPAILSHTTSCRPPAELLVIDNDPAGSAAEAVRQFSDRGVRYVHEPRPGIAAARNRALRESSADALLVFIDDDERPHEQWLEQLLAAYARFGSAAVVGPVISEFDQEPEDWITAGRFFDRRRLPTGTKIDVAATNNLLLDLRQVNALALTFDESFGQSGGSDTLFTRQLARAGAELVWCDQAVVSDRVPVGRLSRKWVLSRAFRSGNSWIRTSLKMSPTSRERIAIRLRAISLGLVRIAGGSTRVVVGVGARSLGQRVRGIRTVFRGAGMVAGAAGYTYQEYRRPPPTDLRP